MSASDPYRTLGVSRDATDAEIKTAYRALVKAVHPDSGHPGDVERFRAIQQAYELLSDPEKRRRYDAGAWSVSPVSWTSGIDEPLVPFREVRPRHAEAPVHLDIVLSLTEARRGGNVVLEAPYEQACPHCKGRGLDFFGWCGGCRGDGWVETREQIAFRLTPGVSHGDVVTARATNGRTVRARIRIR